MAVVKNITRAEYDALPGINWSALKAGIGKTAAHIRAARLGRKDTPAFRFGRLFHLARLQPELFAALMVVDTKTTTRADAVTADEAATIGDMLHGADRVPVEITDAETAITWDFGGVACKGLIDGLISGRVVDLKTTQNAEPAAFKGEIFKLKYHAQLAFYVDGLRANSVSVDGASILAVEKSDPYAAALYDLAPAWLDLGRSVYEEALAVWAEDGPACYGRQELDVPDWCDPGMRMNEEGGIDL